MRHRADRLKLPPSLELRDPEALARTLKLEQSISPVTRFFRGGTGAAEKLFHSFLAERLATYTGHRNQPQTEDVSHMSKYLHFGQISPTWLALEARKHSAEAGDNVATFIEELLVRRELSMNFVHFRDDYDCYESSARPFLRKSAIRLSTRRIGSRALRRISLPFASRSVVNSEDPLMRAPRSRSLSMPSGDKVER